MIDQSFGVEARISLLLTLSSALPWTHVITKTLYSWWGLTIAITSRVDLEFLRINIEEVDL